MEFKGDRFIDYKGENPFIVPTGYFDKLPLEIQYRVSKGNASTQTPSWMFKAYVGVRHHLAVFFGIVFFVGVAYTGYKYSQRVDDGMVRSDDYFEFVSNNSSQFNEQELIKALENDKKVTTRKTLKRESDKLIDYVVEQQVETAAVEALYKDQQNEVN